MHGQHKQTSHPTSWLTTIPQQPVNLSFGGSCIMATCVAATPATATGALNNCNTHQAATATAPSHCDCHEVLPFVSSSAVHQPPKSSVVPKPRFHPVGRVAALPPQLRLFRYTCSSYDIRGAPNVVQAPRAENTLKPPRALQHATPLLRYDSSFPVPILPTT